jgi:hypothetical protein
VSRHHSLKDWSHAVDIAMIHVRAMRNQHTSEIHVTGGNLYSMTQSRLPAYILSVWWTTMVKQEIEGFRMTRLVWIVFWH